MVSLVFLVAGLSSRFDGNIKSFALLGSKMLIEHSLDQALQCKFNNIIFVVSKHTKQPFIDKFGIFHNNIPIIYCEQTYDINTRSRPWGTCDALCCIYPYVDDCFIICNGDDLYGYNTFKLGYDKLISTTDNYNICYKLGSTLPKEGTVNRGVCTVDDNNNICSIVEELGVEKSKCTEEKLNTLCSTNFLCLRKSIFDGLIPTNEKFKNDNKNNKTIEHLLATYLGTMISSKKLSMKYCLSTDEFYGITRKEDIAEIIAQKPYFLKD